jgi:hypothetical protein
MSIDGGDGYCDAQDPLDCVYPESYGDKAGYLILPESSLEETRRRIQASHWDVPSAVGLHIGGSIQGNYVIEGGGLLELSSLFNWRTGVVSILKTGGNFIYIGTPSGLQGSIYVGTTSVSGLSDDTLLEGPDRFGSIGGSVDAMLGIGRSESKSWSVVDDGNPLLSPRFIDRVSNREITTRQSDATASINLVPNAIDFGVSGGVTRTNLIWSYKLPIWPSYEE